MEEMEVKFLNIDPEAMEKNREECTLRYNVKI